MAPQFSSFVADDEEDQDSNGLPKASDTPFRSFAPDEEKRPSALRRFSDAVGQTIDTVTKPMPKHQPVNLPSSQEVEDAARTFEGVPLEPAKQKEKPAKQKEVKSEELKPAASHQEKKKEESKGFIESVVGKGQEFLATHPRTRRFLLGATPEETGADKAGITDTVGPGLQEIPGVRRATDYLANKIVGSEGNLRLGAGAVVKALGEILGSGTDPRTVGTGPARPEKPFGFDEFTASPVEPQGPKQIGFGQTEEAASIRPPRRLLPPGDETPIPQDLSVRRASNLPPDLAAPGEESIFNAKRAEDVVKPIEQSLFERARAATGGKELPDELAVARKTPEETARVLGDETSSKVPESFVPHQAPPETSLAKPSEVAVAEKKPFVSPFAPKEQAPVQADLVPAQQEGKIGPYANHTPQQLIKLVATGEKPSAILENISESQLPSVIKQAQTMGLHVEDNPVVPNEPIISKVPSVGKRLAQSVDNGDHALTGKLLGYSQADIDKFQSQFPGELPKSFSPSSEETKVPELVNEDNKLKTKEDFIKEGFKVPERQSDGSILIHNMYGKGYHGTGRSEDVAFINDTNRMRRLKGENAPEEFKLEEAPKKELIIKNAPPNQRAKMFRGAHEPVDILFNSSDDREIFGSGQRGFSKEGTLKKGVTERLIRASNSISNKYNLTTQKARELIMDYNKEIRTQGSKIDVNGGNFTAPSFGEFIKDKIQGKASTIGANKSVLRDKIEKIPGESETPESLHPHLTGLKNYGDGVLYLDFNKEGNLTPEKVKELFPNKNVEVTELYTNKILPDRFRIDVKGKDLVESEKLGNEIEQSVGGSFDKTIKSLSERLGSESGMASLGGKGKGTPRPFKGPNGATLDKLFQALEDSAVLRGEQESSYTEERARRFAAFEGVKARGAKGAAQSLGKLKGEYEKVGGVELGLSEKEVDSLFSTIKFANISTPEKARAYSALFGMLEGESVPTRSELKVLDDVFGGGFSDRIVEMHGGIGPIGFKLAKTANTMKAMRSSIDFSAPLRQGIGLIHRPEYRKAFIEMFKYFAYPEYFKQAMDDIHKDPYYLLAREAGVFLAKPGDFLQGEEAFMNTFIGSIPKITGIPLGIEASERAYTGFLNKLRFDTFKSLIIKAKKGGSEPYTTVEDEETGKTRVAPSKVAENIAKYINVSTGRGTLGRFEKIAPELNAAIWSPRLISSRLTILANPKYYMSMDPFTRREAIKTLFAIAGAGITIGGLAYLANEARGGKAKIGTDVLSADFGKTRLDSNNLVDPWAGFQQPIVATMRFITGQNATRSQTGTTTLENFAANKLSPIAKLAYDLGSSQRPWNMRQAGGDITTLGVPQYAGFKDRYGQQKYANTEIMKAFVPMFIQDVTDVMKSDADFAEQVGLDTASLFGVGIQNYPEQGAKNKIPKMNMRRLKP